MENEMREFKMRNLKAKDVFKMSRILSKIDVDLKSINTAEMTQEQAGMAMVKLVLENIFKAEDEVNEFLGNLVGLSGDEFSELEFDEVMAVMKQFKQQKGLSNFFNSASK